MSGTFGQRLRYGLLAGFLLATVSAAPVFALETVNEEQVVPTTPAPEPSAEPVPVLPTDPPIETAPPADPPPENVPSLPAAVPTVPAVPEQALIDPATGFQIERSSGYLIHPATGYLIEPGTGNLVDGRTWLYTDLRWNPSTGEVVNIFDAPEESASPSASPTQSPATEAAVKPGPETTPSPAPSSPAAELSATSTGMDEGVDWSTHWLTRSAVILLLAAAGALYYVKLRHPGQNYASKP